MSSGLDLANVAGQLDVLPEWPMRETRLESIWQEYPDNDIVLFLERLVAGIRRHRARLHITYISAIRTVCRLDIQEPATLNRWIQLAVDTRMYGAAAFLSRPQEDSQEGGRGPVDADLADLTLGEQKARARRATEKELQKFFSVRHPHVIDIVLNHPRMNEFLMVRYCAVRPIPADLPYKIATHPRWIQFQDVIDTIVLNPTSTQWITLKLLPLVRPATLEDVMTLSGRRQALCQWAEMLRKTLR